jgi:hypothetical protein
MKKLLITTQMKRNTTRRLRLTRKDETMKRITALLLAVTLISITSCAQVKRAPKSQDVSIVGSGNIVSQTRSLSDFDGLEAGLYFNLFIQQGDEYSVVFISDDNFIDYLAAEKNGTMLSFGLKDGYAYNFSNVTLRVEVTMPELARLNLNESSQATFKGFQPVESFEATLTGSSYLSGEFVAEYVGLDVNGSSSVLLSGSSDYLSLEGCGNSMTDLKGFKVKDAEIEMACNGAAIVHVDGQLEGEAAQYSVVFYHGQPAELAMQRVESATIRRAE